MAGDITAVFLTARLAAATTLILLALGTPLAWWLARTRWPGKVLIEAVVALPLVLPPTVLGYYLLVLLGPSGFVGGWLEKLGGHHLAFTFEGLLVASVLYSLPFAVQPLQDAFASVGELPLEVAATLRAGPWRRLFTVALPMARRGFVSAAAMTFAHTLGEFGVILMVGGNIPGVTRVLSIAIYDHAEALDHASAQMLSGGLLLFSFTLLVSLYLVNRRFERARL
ncbi:MAG: molybdate ABC transporter permease subunit [Candidatus Wallbacteria bacterium]|nr:molybdate ABC transporter permease subunit [Candidatus Wallbacteria bacterium]